MMWVILLSQTDASSELIKTALTYGITPVLLVVMSIMGLVWFKPSVDRLIHDLDAVTKKLEERDAILRDIIVPAVTESNTLLKEVALQLARRRAS